jgi:adenylate cyclase
MRRVGDEEDLPPVKIGMAAGEVLVREGDVFGSAVNRAARLVRIAEPNTIVVDFEVASRLDAHATNHLGSQSVPGFDAPIDAFRLVS